MTETADLWCLTPISVNNNFTDWHVFDRGEPVATFFNIFL